MLNLLPTGHAESKEDVVRRRCLIVPAGWTATVVVAALLGAAGPTGSGRASGLAPGTPPPRVTMITDSVGGVLFWATQQRDRLAVGLDFRLETKTCRKLVAPGCFAYDEVPPSALATIERLGPELGKLVVVDVGYNDLAEAYASDIDVVMRALAGAGVERVVWVTLLESQETWARINDDIRAAARRWPQLVVADWAPVAAREPSWFVDAAHMNDQGAEGFVTFLRPIVLAECGDPCVPPPVVTIVKPAATMLRPLVSPTRVTLRWRGNASARSFDLALRAAGDAWRTVASRLVATSYNVRGSAGERLQARVRARDRAGVPGTWSRLQPFRFVPATA
jgi:hypothetical protein